jgi:2-methylisocitrate lyase-like PEP mutase family enzyme
MISNPTLKELLSRGQILVVPASYDMVSAKLIERAGFPAVYLSGYGHCASHLGLPDAGLISFSEMLERLHHLVRSVRIPVLADADTGFGSVINIRRTVQEYEWAGAQAIQIEDQEIPKKCGHTPGKRLAEASEMVRKVEAAVAARRSDQFLIIARTDAVSVFGIDEAIRREALYRKAGADVLFVESPTTVDDIRKVADELEGPLMINQIERGQTPLLPVRQLEQLGYSLVAFALTTLMASVRAMQKVLLTLQQRGSAEQYLNEIATFEELDELLGFPEVRRWEKQFQGGA